MNEIIVDLECGCFKKSEFENNSQFSSKDDALIQAGLMATHMNTKFCGKHEFQLLEDGDKFRISPIVVTKTAGCCGGGHCS